MKALIAASLAAATLALAVPSQAAPLTVTTQASAGQVTLVADGCGRYRHWSRYWRRCVPN